MSPTSSWKEYFLEHQCLFEHDGNPRKPYAYVSSGDISEGYFHGRRLQENPLVFSRTAEGLAHHIRERIVDTQVDRVIGASTSGISLSSYVAHYLEAKTAFADRTSSGFRFTGFSVASGEQILIVDDTITSGATLRQLVAACKEQFPHATLLPVAAVICNRSGALVMDSFHILSLLYWPVRRWKEGENPFTPDGRECVLPVYPKDDWDSLFKVYE